MDLGRGKFRRNGVNTLMRAVHRKHGLAWTDGKSVYLIPIATGGQGLKDTQSTKLGEFEHVSSLTWSCDISVNTCYLCVTHSTTVSLWKVEGTLPNLNFKQIRKINATPVSQGVLWNPSRDILCILNRDQCSFYFRHSLNKGSFSLPPIDSGRISCGCWSDDGKKLVVGIGSIVLIYVWPDIDKSISDYTITAWKIPNVDGKILALTSIHDSTMLCTAELPLDTLCSKPKTEFTLTESKSLVNDSPLSALPDLDIIRPAHSNNGLSNGNALLNLNTKEKAIHDSSQLILFSMEGKGQEPSKLASCNIDGLLSPDLLLYQEKRKLAVVGSNTQNSLQMFSVTDSSLQILDNVSLSSEQRPKGICTLPGGLLVLVGTPCKVDPAFLPASINVQYDLQLRFLPHAKDLGGRGRKLSSGEVINDSPSNGNPSNGSPSNGNHSNGSPSVQLRFSPISKELRRQAVHAIEMAQEPPLHPSASNVSISSRLSLEANHALRSTAGQENGGSPGRARIVDLNGSGTDSELETENTDFSASVPNFKNPNVANFGSSSGSGFLSGTSSRNSSGSGGSGRLSALTNHDTESGVSVNSCTGAQDGGGDSGSVAQHQVAALERHVQTQGEQIVLIQQKIDRISRLLAETKCVPIERYKPVSQPEVVTLILKQDGCPEVKKVFIIDDGRLQLETVREAFGLYTVEMQIDGVSCVLSANVDGYIPVKFQTNSSMYITGAKPSPANAPVPPARRSRSRQANASKC